MHSYGPSDIPCPLGGRYAGQVGCMNRAKFPAGSRHQNSIERLGPMEAQQQIVVSGFSYPSGHSLSTSALHLTVAIIGCREMPRSGAGHNCTGRLDNARKGGSVAIALSLGAAGAPTQRVLCVLWTSLGSLKLQSKHKFATS